MAGGRWAVGLALVLVGMGPAWGQPAPAPAKVAAPAQPAAAPAPTAPAPRPAGLADPNAIRVLLSPELETTLVAQMVGRIATLNASLGGFVDKGKPIVVFDCGEARARLQMAQAEHTAARDTLDVKNRLYKLEAAGETEVSQANAAVSKSRASIALAQAQLSQCSVPAPFAGRIVRIHVKPHQGVNVGNPLVEMVSEGPLKLRLNVPSRFLRSIKTGGRFEVEIEETGKTYRAQITAINARVDAVAQTVELEARIDGQHDELLAGMTGVARFPNIQ